MAPSFLMSNVKSKELMTAFGNHIRELRKKKKLSMQNLAADAGIEYKQPANVELGKINTTISTAYALAKALDTTLDKLFSFEIKVSSKPKK